MHPFTSRQRPAPVITPPPSFPRTRRHPTLHLRSAPTPSSHGYADPATRSSSLHIHRVISANVANRPILVIPAKAGTQRKARASGSTLSRNRG